VSAATSQKNYLNNFITKLGEEGVKLYLADVHCTYTAQLCVSSSASNKVTPHLVLGLVVSVDGFALVCTFVGFTGPNPSPPRRACMRRCSALIPQPIPSCSLSPQTQILPPPLHQPPISPPQDHISLHLPESPKVPILERCQLGLQRQGEWIHQLAPLFGFLGGKIHIHVVGLHQIGWRIK
jgi:hypothetical protein